MSTRDVVLCADDYAMGGGVGRAILDLAELGRVSATSAMTNMPGWPAAAADLRRFDGRVGVGLHLTLTWGAPLGAMPGLAPAGRFPDLGALIGRALSGRLDVAETEAEIARQWGAFVDDFGREPDFVDGHQHVHVLPGVRSALFRVLARRRDARLWVRDPRDRLGAIARRPSVGKAAIVAALATGFAGAAARAGIATNRGFSGFSAFAPGQDLEREFAAFLSGLGPRPLVMCHPGHVAPGDDPDGIGEARGREHAYLASPDFAALLRRQSVRLVPGPA